MKKKIKLFSTVATLCLTLALMAFGVFSALTVTYKTTGTISYEIADTYVEIETRIYSTSKKFDDADTLKAKAQEFEASNFAALDALTATGIVEGEGESQVTHDFNKVQLKNLEQEEDYVVQASDYVDTYSSVTATEAPEDLEVALTYKTAQGSDKGVYTYFVVTKLTNKSALPLYVTIPTTGEDAYAAPDNNHTYKFADEYKTIATLDDSIYVVFAMSLDDITVAIAGDNFAYPIHIAKDAPTPPEPEGGEETSSLKLDLQEAATTKRKMEF